MHRSFRRWRWRASSCASCPAATPASWCALQSAKFCLDSIAGEDTAALHDFQALVFTAPPRVVLCQRTCALTLEALVESVHEVQNALADMFVTAGSGAAVHGARPRDAACVHRNSGPPGAAEPRNGRAALGRMINPVIQPPQVPESQQQPMMRPSNSARRRCCRPRPAGHTSTSLHETGSGVPQVTAEQESHKSRSRRTYVFGRHSSPQRLHRWRSQPRRSVDAYALSGAIR